MLSKGGWEERSLSGLSATVRVKDSSNHKQLSKNASQDDFDMFLLANMLTHSLFLFLTRSWWWWPSSIVGRNYDLKQEINLQQKNFPILKLPTNNIQFVLCCQPIEYNGKDRPTELLLRCTAFFNQILTRLLQILNWNIKYPGKKYLCALFGAII